MARNSWSHLLGRFGLTRKNTATTRSREKRIKLRLEALEDRFAPASVIQTASYGPATLDWNANLAPANPGVFKFDSTLGTLTAVVVSETANMKLSGSVNKIQ